MPQTYIVLIKDDSLNGYYSRDVVYNVVPKEQASRLSRAEAQSICSNLRELGYREAIAERQT